MVAIKAVHVSDVLNLDHVPESPPAALYSSRFSQDIKFESTTSRPSKFIVIGHRGNGMNMLQSSDKRMKSIKENSILSFNTAGLFPVDFIEFDVQVTKDDCPIIFHDDFILCDDNGTISEKRVTDLTLSEFMDYGHQKDSNKAGKSLIRRSKDGKIWKWEVETDDAHCTLQEALQNVKPSLGFNVELKFDDHIVYHQDQLTHILQSMLQVVYNYADGRRIIFSSFHPDAAQLVRKLQTTYPVFFLTNGGSETYLDVRRNSLEEALKWSLENGLQGIVSEVKAIFANPGAVTMIKESNLSLLTYGKLNNVPEAVYMQHLMGIDGVIVDFVQEITEAVSRLIRPDEERLSEAKEQIDIRMKPQFSQLELSFLLKLIPQLLQL